MKAIKLLVLLVVLGVVVAVAGGVAFLAFSDPNDFKEAIAAKVKAETGRTLTIEGDLEWGFWPKLRLKTGPLSLGNIAGFDERPLFAVKELQIAVATLPLFKKTVEMDTVQFRGVEVHLEKNAAGATNWADLAGEGAPREGGPLPITSLALGGVDITDATLTWRDATTGNDVSITKLNVSTGALAFGEPIAFKLSLNAVAKQPALDADAALAGTVAFDTGADHYTLKPLDLDVLLRGARLPGGQAAVKGSAVVDVNFEEGTASIGDLAMTGLGTKIAGNIAATDIAAERPSAKGWIELDGEDLALLFSVLELPVAEQLGKVKDRAFRFRTEFDADMDSGEVQVSKFDGRVLGATVTGQLDAHKANTDELTAKGALSAKGPDLPALLAVVGQLQGADAATLESLRAALANAKDRSFSVSTEIDADLEAGRFDLPKLSALILGNTLSGVVQVTNATADQPGFKGSLKADGPDLPALLAVAGVMQKSPALADMARSLATAPDKSFTVETTFDADPAAGSMALPKLTASGLGMTVEGRLKGRNLEKPDGAIDGALAVDSARPGPLLTALGQKDLAAAIRSIHLDVGLTGSMSDLTLSPFALTAEVAGAEGKQPIPLKLTAGSARADLAKETVTVRDLALTGLGINAHGNLDATQIKKDLAFSGDFKVPAFDARAVFANLNQKLPEMADGKALTRVSLATQLKGTAGSVTLNGLELQVDETNVKGNLSVGDFAGVDVSFAIGVDTLNADRYLPPKPAGKARPPAPEAAAGAAAQLPVKTLRALKIKGDLEIGKLQISGAKMQNIKVGIRASGGNIQVNPIAADLYQGKYAGQIGLDARQDQAALSIHTNLAQVAAGPLIVDTTGSDKLAGVVDFDSRFNATGGRSEMLKKSLGGQGKFSVRDGVFRGLDAVAILHAAETIIETKQLVALPPKGGETRFQSLTGTLNANSGVLTVNDLLVNGAGFKVLGKGILANLQNDQVKYDLEIAVDEKEKGAARYNLGGYAIPVQCRGNIAEPKCLPDFAVLISKAVKKEAVKKLGETLDKSIDKKTGDTLKKLFKF